MSGKSSIVYDIPWVVQNMVTQIPKTSARRQEHLTFLEEKLSELETGDFFAFENVEEQKNVLEEKIALEKLYIRMNELGYPKIDYRFLALSKKDIPLPAFMILDTSSNDKEFSLTIRPISSKVTNIDDVIVRIKPYLPGVLENQFDKFAVHLGKLSLRNYGSDEIVISANFTGTVPSGVRAEIRQVQEAEVFDDIFIVRNAPPKWQIDRTGRTNIGDPLVVGWNNKMDKMFLIATFDVSSLENYILNKFVK